MKLLVTGGAGFIGSNFIRYWLKKYPNDSIINLDKLTYAGNLENLKGLDDRHEFNKFDICCTDSNGSFNQNLFAKLKEWVSQCDIIVHFAAETHVDRSIINAQEFIMTNVWGTHILLEAAVQAWKESGYKNKRFHHISTDEVFGALELDDQAKFNELTVYNPHSPYAASKAGSDHLVRAYHDTYGLPVTITNTSNNYGPYQYPEKLLPLAITNLLEGKKVPVYGDGKYVRDWLYVEDHCRAIDLVLKKGQVRETYCIGGQMKDVNNLGLIRMLLKITGKKESEIEFVKDRPGHDRRYAVDFSKAEKELGYRPLFALEEYLEKTVEWYRVNEWWWKKIKSGEYLEYYRKQYRNSHN